MVPVVVVLGWIAVNSLVLASVNNEVGLTVAVQIEFAQSDPAFDRLLEDPSRYSHAMPRYFSRESYVDRDQLHKVENEDFSLPGLVLKVATDSFVWQPARLSQRSSQKDDLKYRCEGRKGSHHDHRKARKDKVFSRERQSVIELEDQGSPCASSFKTRRGRAWPLGYRHRTRFSLGSCIGQRPYSYPKFPDEAKQRDMFEKII